MGVRLPVKVTLGFRSGILLILILGMLGGCAGQPDRTETAAMSRLQPWGAQHPIAPLEPDDPSVAAAMTRRLQDKIDQHPDSGIPYNVLALSGGGPRGAYGAGLLSGWSLTGERPEFDVVTGISVGALLATYAFLGSDYDRQMQEDAYAASLALSERRFRLGASSRAALFAGDGLHKLLDVSINEALLDAVAAEYRKGRRLFIGTTNLDDRRFAIWDMGQIAISQRPDRVERYRNVLLASAAVPLYFPPVMIPLETPGGEDRQMHVDGGVYKNVFVTDFNGTLLRVMRDNNRRPQDLHGRLFVLVNGQLAVEQPPPPVRKALFPVAGNSVSAMMRANSAAGVHQLWLMAMLGGTQFNLAYIPANVRFYSSLTELDLEEMRQLFQLGFEHGRTNQGWLTQNAPEDIEQLRTEFSLDTLESLFWRHFQPEGRAQRWHHEEGQ